MLTDPPWPGCEHVPIHGSNDAVRVWARVAALVPQVADRLILHLGHNTDPRGMVDAVPRSMPFLTVVTLRMVPPGYRGCLMSGELAYVYGKLRLPHGEHILPGEITANASARLREETQHPCPRSAQHVRGLLLNYCAKADLVIDPFCGSGTTLAEAAKLGLNAIGIDSDERWVLEARALVARVSTQCLLDFNARHEQALLFGSEQ